MREKISKSIALYVSLRHVESSDPITEYNAWAKENRELLKNDKEKKYAFRCFKTFTYNYKTLKSVFSE